MRTSPFLGAASLALFSAACSDSTGTGSSATVAFNVATRAAVEVPLAMSGVPDTLADGGNVLVIDTAQLVIRDIKLHLVEDDLRCSDDDDDDDDRNRGDDSTRSGDGIRVSHSSDDDDDGDDDDCDEIRVGPFLLDLPLGPGAARQFTVEVPAGSYREVDFKVHTPSDDSDAAFLAAHPEFRGRSVRVVGSWNGTPFTFTSDANASQESEFNPPLVAGEGTGTDLTLFVDLSTWFRVNGALVDPALANGDGPLADAVEDNIRASIRAFEDGDRDGCDDHDEDDRDDDGNNGPGGSSDD